jgi:hypothetical protein
VPVKTAESWPGMIGAVGIRLAGGLESSVAVKPRSLIGYRTAVYFVRLRGSQHHGPVFAKPTQTLKLTYHPRPDP